MHRSLLATLAVSVVACRSSAPSVVHHFDDDYEGARAAAMSSKLPLVVEVWAPW
jgi:hypothetical protein